MRTRLFVVLLVLAIAGAFGAGWWIRGRSDPSWEDRTHEAADHINEAVRSLTR